MFKIPSNLKIIANTIILVTIKNNNTAWKVSEYGPEKTPYLYTFHAV